MQQVKPAEELPEQIKDNPERMRILAEIQVLQQKAQEREFPSGLASSEVFMHANSFLYALDGFGKALKVMSAETSVPEAAPLTAILAKFDIAFPNLSKVRNSAQHIEDRRRGLGAGSQPKPLVPRRDDARVNPNGIIGQVLMLNTLMGTHYGNTMADGYYGEVNVSADSMRTLQGIYQRILAALPWGGCPELIPRFN